MSARSGLLQRKCACGGAAGLTDKCAECSHKSSTLQRRARAPSMPDTVPPIVHDVLNSAGQPLDPATRTFMGARFGHDFSQVRIHTDARAAKSARLINAQAYTVGHDVVFEAGQYQPGTADGRKLLAHELTHVVQQAHNQPGSTIRMVPDTDHSEAEARRLAPTVLGAAAVGSVGPTSLTPLQLTRNGKPGGFKISAADMEHLRSTMEELLGHLDEGTRDTITRNKTVAIGIVVDEEGQPTMVYTVSGNWTNKNLEAAAKKTGVTRWEATPRTGGRGARGDVGAPGDAEQLMVEAADTNGFKVGGMAVSRTVCPDCKEEIHAYEHGPIPVVEVKTPERKGPRGGGTPEGEWGEEEGAASTGRIGAEAGEGEEGFIGRRVGPMEEDVEVEIMPSRRGTALKGGEGPGDMPPSPRTVVMGVTLTFAAGIAVNLLSGAFRDKVESDLAKMPKPKIDKRSAKGFLSDPDTAASKRLIDILSQDLLPFGRELRAKQEKVLAAAQLKMLTVGVSALSSEERLEYLSSIGDELDGYEEQLSTVEDNLDAILEKKDEALKTAKACDDLRAILNTVYMEHHWLETGFSVEQHEDVDSNLANLAVTIRIAFRDAQTLKDRIAKLEEEEQSFRKSLRAATNQEFAVVYEARLKEQQQRSAAAAAGKGPPVGAAAPRKRIPSALLPTPGAVAKPPTFSPQAAIQPWDDRVKGSADVASTFEGEKSWLVATESKLRQLAHENKRGTATYATLYNQFDAKRSVWPGQLAQSIALLTKENASGYEQSINRLKALQDWLRTEGQSLLDQVMPPE